MFATVSDNLPAEMQEVANEADQRLRKAMDDIQ